MIDENKVKEEFNRRAVLHNNSNAVLDADSSEKAKFSNYYRDYLSKVGLIKTMSIDKTKSVLDFGCGVGRLSKYLSSKVKRIVGVDVSDKMVEVAVKNNWADNISYFAIDNESTGLVNKFAFDIIFSYWVFQHISEKKISSLLREFTQILDSNGRIYIYEQIQQKKAVSVEVHVMRKEEDYIELFRQEGFEFVKSTKLFRMPSYGMSLFNKIGMNHPIILKFCSMIEFHTIDRKPEFVDYFTICLEFRKSTTS